MEAMPSSSPEMSDLAPRRSSGQRAGAAAPGGGARPRAACSPRGERGEGGACSARRRRQAVGRLLPTQEQEKGGRGSSIPAVLADAVEGSHSSENAVSARVAAIIVSKLREARSCSGTTRRVRALELHHAAVGHHRGRVPGKGQQGAAPATGAMRRPEGVWVGWRWGRRKGK